MFKPIGVALVASAFFAVAARAGLSYRIYPLGPIGASEHEAPNGLNDHGSVAAGAAWDGSIQAAIVWNEGVATRIPLGPDLSEFANGINDNGAVVGMIVQNDFSAHAYVWNGKTVTLLPGADGQANAINNSGKIVGSSAVGGVQRATVWDNTQATVLNIPNSSQSEATATNNHGDVVGESVESSIQRGFIERGGKITLLPTLGGNLDRVNAVNDKDQVVGSSGGRHAVLWSNGTVHQLTPLPNYQDDYAFGINDEGSIVGASPDDFGLGLPNVATIWNNGTPTDLNSFLPTNSGWRLLEANSINDRGQIIGIGDFKGQQQPFILTPSTTAIPLPSSLLIGLTTFPLAMFASLRRRKSGLQR